MSKLFIKTIKSFDLFQKPVQLMIKKEDAHTTMFGALMTLFLLTLVFVLLISNLISLFNRDQPKVLQSDLFTPDPDRIELHPSNFTFQVGLEDAVHGTYIDDSIYKLNAQLVTRYHNSTNSSDLAQWLYEDIPLTRCSYKNVIRQEELSEFFSSVDQSNLWCIDWDKTDKLILQGQFTSPNYTYILINIVTCTKENSKDGDPPCRDQDYINEQLSHNYVQIQFSSSILDAKDPIKPFKSIGFDKYTTISPQTFKEINYYFQPISVTTDKGLVTSDNYFQKSMEFQQASELVDISSTTNIAQIIFRLATVESQTYRSYTKFQDILGQVGGLWNVLFLVAKYFQYPLSLLSYRLAIINSLFNFDGQDEEINEESSRKKKQTLQTLNVPKDQLFTNRDEQQIQPIRKDKKKLSSIQKKLQTIKVQNELLGSAQEEGSQKNKYATQLNESIKHFFDTVTKKLKLGFLEFTTQFRIGSTKTKQIQYEYSVKKMEKSLDVLYIIKKIQEIDKLKVLLLNQHQIKVFDYLPKPLITEDPNNINNQPYFSILSPSKSNFQKAIEAQIAFREIMNNLKDPINQQLIKCMDTEILELLKMQLTNEKSFTSSQQYIDDKKPLLTNLEVNVISCDQYLSQPIEEDQEERILQVRNV